jgi:hypothetical protein
MPQFDAILDEHGQRFGYMAAPLLPETDRSWSEGRAVARAGSPRIEEGDDSAIWKLRMGSKAADLDAAIERALSAMPASNSLCLRPDAAGVLSDVPTCLGVLRRFEGRVELLLAPADLMVASMARHAGDHLLKILAAFAGHPAVRGVILEDVRTEGDNLEGCAAGEGMIPAIAWRGGMALVVQAGWPIVVGRWDRSAHLRGL